MKKPWVSSLASFSLISYPDSEEDGLSQDGMFRAIQESVDHALGSAVPDERPVVPETSDWKKRPHFADPTQAHN